MEQFLEDSIIDQINNKLQETGELDKEDALILLAYIYQQRRKEILKEFLK